MASPSIVPSDRLDKDFYLVLEEFRDGAAFCETDEGIDHSTLINDLLAGQYGQVLRVVAFNPIEGWSRDASEDIAHELEDRIAAEGREISGRLRDFVESQIGRKVGVQLALPLPMAGHG
ncbi:hypothetical protein ABIF65_003862 [Bradyrhizobium japonicum]|uniref:hypothetical protein n=1 Tax=Bradyrhizobium TaxID=374 RepID=UPI00040B3C0D|nr:MULTISPECIES: hypothetical protein [Bradyrhizobium]MCP1741689.1 hypothetical protein [Bradyrhizobium japonicum]MCP1779488.1 hypothetical protein [Bradyrhizobium japonicum]MCP1859399.1 hypothetical protein [Bradyrhizobium japonicum]MCP1890166.1 hypothetical protein [Bradyrhizobium japonicum]MCP1957517.1 hypothetical protein [Bradyrhizobium japonicum]